MSEQFLIKAIGGPMPGTRVADSLDEMRTQTWPLPDVLEYDETGHYVKVRESSRPQQPRGSLILRGAEYEWRPLQ